MLTLSSVSIGFENKKSFTPVVQDLNLSVAPGSCMGLVGESGSGKTLSALTILQLLPHTARVDQKSAIYFHDQNLLSLSEKKMRCIRGKHIGMIFQDAMSAFNPVFTIGQQISESVRLHLFLSAKAAMTRTLSLLESVGITDTARCFRAYPHELSGGMRQRAMIAMAIAAEPTLLIADEPTTALDVTIQAQIINLLNQLKKEKKCGLLFIGHDLAVVSKLADDITVLKNGITMEQAPAKLFFLQPKTTYSQKLLDATLPIVAQKNPVVSATPLLSVESLSVHFALRGGILKRVHQVIKAVDDVSLHVNQGETIALVGESGSGKTSVAKAIMQLIPRVSGAITVDGESWSNLSATQLRKQRAHMQLIFQDPFSALNPRMLIIDSLCEGLKIQKKISKKSDTRALLVDLLHEVNLSDDVLWRYPHEFSGGQRQRLCIARALTLSPKLLILDEPTSALDMSTQKQILLLLERLQKEKKLSYLLITHNISVVAYLAHTVAVMHQGKIVEQGCTHDVLTKPQAAYTQKLLDSVPKIE